MRVRAEAPRQFGLYRVTGGRNYRGHEPGSEFVAQLDRNAERRAVNRRDIVLLEHVIPALEPGSFTFPNGWLAQPSTSSPQSAERRSSH